MTITALTADQRAAIPEHVQRWIDIGLSTEPVCRERATEAVLKCYVLAGLPAPRVEFADSFRPYAAPAGSVCDAVWTAVRGEVWESIGDVVYDEVYDAVIDVVWAAVWEAFRGEFRRVVSDEVWAAVCSGQHDADACAAWRYCVDVLGIEVSANIRARIDAWCAIVQSCGGVYWGRDVVTVVDRPEAFERDSDGRITAVVYRDGWRVQV